MGGDLIVRGRHAAEFPKHPVKLGETGKPCLFRDPGDLVFGIEQQVLGIFNAGQLDILDHGVACDSLKLVGQVVGADVKGIGQGGQGDVVAVVGVESGKAGIFSRLYDV